MCTFPVQYDVVRAPAGMPDFVSPRYPEHAWLGWSWTTEGPDQLALIALCSQTCLLDWLENFAAPGA